MTPSSSPRASSKNQTDHRNQMDQTDQLNETDQINLRDYWRIILKHRKLIITFFLVTVTTVAIHSLTMIPVYRSTTQILIERANPNIFSVQEMFVIDPSGQDFYQTQYKILESRALALDVIKRLNLAEHPEFKGVEEEAGIFSYFKDLKNTTIMESHDDSWLVNAFLGSLEVEPIRNSRLVNISFESTHPELSARIANTLVKAYIDWNLGLRLKSQQAASQFLDDQVKAGKLKLEASELALQQYREKYGVAIISSQSGKNSEYGQALSRQKLLTVSKQLLDTKNKRIEAEIKYKNALKK